MRRVVTVVLAIASALVLAIGGGTTAGAGSAAVAGTVVDAMTGAPLPGIAVSVVSNFGEPLETTTTGADGRYAFSDLDNLSFVQIQTLDTAGYHVAGYGSVALHPATTRTVDISMELGGRLHGTVTDANGNPVLDACVSDADALYVCVDEAGQFDTPPMYPGEQWLYVETDAPLAFETELFTVVAGTTTPITLTGTTVPALDLTITDSATGAPIASVCAELAGQSYGCADDETGTIRFVSPPTGAQDVYVFASGYEEAATTVEIAETGITTAAVQLTVNAGSITGTLTAANGGPAAGACVGAFPAATYSPGTSFPMATVCAGPDGSYTIYSLAPGAYVLEVGFTYTTSSRYVEARRPGQVSILTGQTASGVDAVVDELGVVTGTVLDAVTGEPLGGATVAIGSGPSTSSAADGTYRLYLPSAGLQPRATRVGYLDVAYDDPTTPGAPDTVTVPVNGVRTGVDFRMSRAGTITGTVRTAGGAPVPYACAAATSGTFTRSDCADASGRYEIEGLAAGAWAVRFTASGYVAEYYNDAPTAAAATLLTVTPPNVTAGIDAALTAQAVISGRIVDAVSGAPLQTSVSVIPVGATFGPNGFSGPDGTYRVAVNPGRYVVRVAATGYSTQYYDGAATLAAATEVVAGSGDVPGIDFALRPRSAVTGTVTAAGGAPVSGITVSAFRPDNRNSAVASITTGADGRYRLLVDDGTYVIQYRDQAFDAVDYLTEYWSDQATFATAGLVTISETGAVANAELALGGRITGTVSLASGGPAVSAQVRLPLPDGTSETAFTDSSGRYVLRSVAPGTHTLTATGSQTGQATASATVQAGVTTTADMTLPSGAVISGRVTDSAGAPIGGVSVSAYVSFPSNPSAWSVWSSATTATNGTYTVTVDTPAAGRTYLVGAAKVGYRTELYLDATTVAAATRVASGATGVDLQLATLQPATISGKLTDDVSGVPIAGCVVANSQETPRSAQAFVCTDASGAYSLTVTPGQYFISTYNTGSYLSNNGALVTVAADEAVTRDFALTLGAVVDVTVVSAEDGRSLEGTCATLAGPLMSTSRCGSGAYRVGPVRPGTYTLKVENPNGRYVAEWHDDAYTVGAATAMTLAAGGEPDVTVDLVLGAGLRGTVRNSDGAAIPGACVTVNGAARVLASGCADVAGHFNLSGIFPGTWDVTISAPAYRSEVRTGVQFVAGQTVSGFDVALRAAGPDIDATVIDAATDEPIDGVCSYLYDAFDGNYLGVAYCAAADGVVRFVGLAPGTYWLGTVKAGYATDWSEVAVGTDPVSTTIRLAAETVGTSITGTISSGGTSVEGVCALLYDGDSYAGGYACSDDAGRYSMSVATPAAPHTYQLRTFDPDARFGAGPAVDVELGAEETVVADLTVAAVASVAGRVTDSTSGEGIGNVCVYLYTAAGAPAGHATCTRADGHWALTVPDGTYKLGAADPTASHRTAWSGGGADLTSATTFVVVAGEVTIVDTPMDVLAGVRVTVRDADGSPVAGVCMYLYGPDGSTYAGLGTCSGADGVAAIYTPAGTYRLAFFDPAGRFATTWLGGTTGSAATDVVVASSFRDLGDVEVHEIGALSGRVTDTDGNPVADVSVYVNNASDGTYAGRYGVTDSEGNYRIDGLPAGSYTVGFYPVGMASPTTIWFRDASSEAAAEAVDVAGGRTTEGIDAIVPAVAAELAAPAAEVTRGTLDAADGALDAGVPDVASDDTTNTTSTTTATTTTAVATESSSTTVAATTTEGR